MSWSKTPAGRRYLLGFVAGVIAVLVFHQGMLTVLSVTGFSATSPFPTHATWPFGVPKVWSLAFWGGVWGLIFVAVLKWLPGGVGFWAASLVFGALGPTLVAWFVVAPLQGAAVAGGWAPTAMATGVLINGAWGLGTALLLSAFASGGGALKPLR